MAEKPRTIFVAWFDDTYKKLNQFLQAHNFERSVILYKQIIVAQREQYIFVEHHPLKLKEEDLFKTLQLESATILCSLDEAFFKQFGSENIVAILTKMGMEPNEQIEHSMITSSIQKAQDKIAAKVVVDLTATSQEEWLRMNIK